MFNNPRAIIQMENGRRMVLELFPEKAPITVANFVDLAEGHFYDGLTFHRVVKGFVIQGGSANNTCECETDFFIKGEFASNGVDTGLQHVRGALSMARDPNPDSAGTQFFIVHQCVPRLDGNYAVFGQLTEGFEVLDEICEVETEDPENRPLIPQTIRSIRIELKDYIPAASERIKNSR